MARYQTEHSRPPVSGTLITELIGPDSTLWLPNATEGRGLQRRITDVSGYRSNWAEKLK